MVENSHFSGTSPVPIVQLLRTTGLMSSSQRGLQKTILRIVDICEIICYSNFCKSIPYSILAKAPLTGPVDPGQRRTILNLEHLDEIAREAWDGNYRRVGVLSTGEVLYVALASGRMRELAPSDSIAYAVDRVGPEAMAHMLTVWKASRQPIN